MSNSQKTCPFCKNQIPVNSEKCPICKMILIERFGIVNREERRSSHSYSNVDINNQNSFSNKSSFLEKKYSHNILFS